MTRKIMAKKKRSPIKSDIPIAKATVIEYSDHTILHFEPYPDADFGFNIDWIINDKGDRDEKQVRWLAEVYGSHLQKAYNMGKKHAREEIAEKYEELIKMIKNLDLVLL